MITVVGSFVVDLMMRTPHLPLAGESCKGHGFKVGPGGKGSNQAVAAARLGSKVNMVAKLGNDDFANIARRNFEKEGISFEHIFADPNESTAAALIIVDENTSENMIAVDCGANLTLKKEEVLEAKDLIANSDVLVVQLESSNESLLTALQIAKENNVKVVFNPAPYGEFPQEVNKLVDVATPNETEASQWTGIEVVDDESAIKASNKIIEMGVKVAVLTLGKRGCLVNDGKECYFVDSFKVNAVDTTGAGDAFNGGLAHAIEQKMELREAVRFANAVAGLSVTKIGTAPAMPTIDEVNEFLMGQ